MASVLRRLSDDGATTSLATDRREVFRDCALIEIIHLHDCLRGAIRALEHDVHALQHVFVHNNKSAVDDAVVADLEGRVFGRFKVIWSVFRAHSTAEDEFIWPALRRKQMQQLTNEQVSTTTNKIPPDDEEDSTALSPSEDTHSPTPDHNNNLVQEEYEEDHADEERMFSEMDSLLTLLKERLNQTRTSHSTTVHPTPLIRRIVEQTERLSNHLLRHLEKEEVHCMPLVLKHLDKAEIHELVGEIMGRRSADTITHIMTMAVQSLEAEERDEMIKYMKQSMKNTFFDKWLLASGWGSSAEQKMSETTSPTKTTPAAASANLDAAKAVAQSLAAATARLGASPTTETNNEAQLDRKRPPPSAQASPVTEKRKRSEITSQAELEGLIRAIATNPALSAEQKNTTIQGLRDSVWKKNQEERLKRGGGHSPPVVPVNGPLPGALPLLSCEGSLQHAAAAPHASVSRVGPSGQTRSLPPAKYFKKNAEGSIELVWSNDSPAPNPLPTDGSVPTFSASELAPTYHDGVAGAVFGCPHYSRACKLRHPKSGKLYTCRLCCDHQRELPMREDEPLDRYAVSEVFCMVCTTLQPSGDRCINPDCPSAHKPFSRYFCRICNLYDDGSRPIFHCPYCNTCRLGLGLGIDYRHCMRCNACVSLDDKEHRCIPQKLQGDCPICHESLFQSTEPLRGVKCGHVMHLSCFNQYRRNRYTCPLCCKSMEDMKDHFALLDAAIRMQPMPVTFLHTMSNIYCQDCGQTGQVPYHFAGLKCFHCSSYNTREMGRVHNT